MLRHATRHAARGRLPSAAASSLRINRACSNHGCCASFQAGRWRSNQNSCTESAPTLIHSSSAFALPAHADGLHRSATHVSPVIRNRSFSSAAEDASSSARVATNVAAATNNSSTKRQVVFRDGYSQMSDSSNGNHPKRHTHHNNNNSNDRGNHMNNHRVGRGNGGRGGGGGRGRGHWRRHRNQGSNNYQNERGDQNGRNNLRQNERNNNRVGTDQQQNAQGHERRQQQPSNSCGGSGAGNDLRARLDRFRSTTVKSSPTVQQRATETNPSAASSAGNKGSSAWRQSHRKDGGKASAASSAIPHATPSEASSPQTQSSNPSGGRDSRGLTKMSTLRDAFMRTIQANREKTRNESKQQQQQQNQVNRRQPWSQQRDSGQRPSWRDRESIERGGRPTDRMQRFQQRNDPTRETESQKILREMEEQEREALRAARSSKRVEAAAAGGASSKGEEANEDSGEPDAGNTITLPHRSLSLSELSGLMRVRISKLRETVSSLGERIPEDDSEAAEHRIDIDVAELAALELGFDPVRAKHGAGHKWKSLEEAERRMRRGVGGKDALAVETTATSEEAKSAEEMEYDSLPSRPPVVCIMGHVDHGKTTLMDALRRRAEASGTAGGKKSKKGAGKKKKKAKNKSATNTKKGKGGAIEGDVAGTEAGGITQIITAFQVSLPSTEDSSDSDAAVTFLDTPGHAAFKSMRRSGSSGADIIVLVVAADDGVSPQTIEILDTYKSIALAQPGSISLVVAMTKIDKPGIDIDKSREKIENQLLEQGVFTEGMASGDEDSEYGPPAQLIPVSGMTGDGLDDLIEGLVLQSEIMDLRADEEARAEGVIMDARVDKGLGVVADCIVRWGKLERGDYVVSGVHGGKIRILSDVGGGALKKARPSQPVRIVGFKTLPKAGDPIVSVQSEEIAKELISRREALASADGTAASAEFRAESTAAAELQITGMASKQGALTQRVLEKYGMDVEDTNETIRIPIIIKADADGSLEAVRDALLAIGDETKRDIVIDPISMGVGAATTSDVTMAKESGASIFCFGLRGSADKAASSMAEADNVSILSNDVIYSLLDEAKDLFATHLPPVSVEKVHGSAEVKAVYDINNKRDAERIAGMQVTEGQLFLDKTTTGDGETLVCHYRIFRNGELVSEEADMLRAKSLRRYKEEVTDVRRGDECGLGLGFEDLQEGDVVECYSTELKHIW